MELTQLGKYKILARIGRGAMGEVYRAYDPILNREVAIKTMSSDIGADEELRKRFEREAQSAARLNHPNVITVYDYGEEQGQVYIAMELLEGIDLKELIKKKAPLPIEEKLALMEQMAEGLAFAHSKGVVHRDLKPANIHVQRGGQVKIMDFGLARFATSDMTRAGAILGTPNYMSPEQVRGEKATAQSDVFSLGAVFYELLTYRKAFSGETLHGVLFQVAQANPEPLGQIVPDLPAELSQVVERALAKDTLRRFGDGGELRDALRAIRSTLGRVAAAARPSIATDTRAATSESDGTTLAATVGTTLTRPAKTAPPAPATALRPSETTRVLPSSREPETVRARARTLPSQPSVTKAAPAVWPSWGLAGAAVFVLLVAIYVVSRPLQREAPSATTPAPAASVEAPAPAPPVPEPVSLEPALEEARRLMDEKDYRAATARAQTVLSKDAQNQEAQAVLEKARARLRLSDQAARDLKRAIDAGDVEQASAALSRLVELDPRHPEVPALTLRLNTAWKGKAEIARQALEKARAQAPAATFVEPEKTNAPPPIQTSSPPMRPEPSSAPASPAGTAAPQIPPPAPAALPPPTAPVAATAPPHTEAQVRQAIQGLLEAYRAAFETLSADALRAIHPTVDYDAMKARFAAVTAFEVKIKLQNVAVQGDTATAACLVTYTPKPKPAGKITPVATLFHLKRSGAVWIIDSVSKN